MPITGTELSTISTDTSAGSGDHGKIVLLSSNGKISGTMLVGVIPAGGTTGQVLAKNSGTDYDVSWTTGGGGSGTITGVTAGTGLSGGGTSGTVSLAVSYGTTSGTSAQGNDSRLNDDRTASGLRTASTVVTVSGSVAPANGYVLAATSGTAAVWKSLDESGLGIGIYKLSASTLSGGVPGSIAFIGPENGASGSIYLKTTTGWQYLFDFYEPIYTIKVNGSNLATSGSATLHSHELNLIAGSGVTLTTGTDLAGVRNTITIAATGGGGGTITGVTAGTAMSGGGTTGTVTVNVDVNAATTKASPTTSDSVLIADAATSGATKKALISSLPFGSGTITGVTAGTALTGGGTSGTVTLNVALGTTGSTAAAGNDSRLSDDRTASGLRSATTVVSVSSATAPTSGQVLTATSGSAATWQTPAGGAATDIATTGASVNVNSASPPSAGQALIATDATHATWQNLSGGGTITGVTAGTALTGGGVSGTVTLDVALGTTGSTAAAGNDARLSDDRTASGIRTATGIVAVSTATAPTTGQALVATSSTAATWQTISIGSGSGYTNAYLAIPSSAGSLDDEFSSGSADLASRGWTVTNDAGTTMTRVGDVTVAYPSALTSTQYRSTLTADGLRIQCTSMMNVAKAFTGSAGFYCHMEAPQPPTSTYYFKAPVVWDVFPAKLDNATRKIRYYIFSTTTRGSDQMDTGQAFTARSTTYAYQSGDAPWGAWIDWDNTGKQWTSMLVNPLANRIYTTPVSTPWAFAAFTPASAGFAVQTAGTSTDTCRWITVRCFRQLPQGKPPGVV